MFNRIDPQLLMTRIDARRKKLAQIRDRSEDAEPLSYVEVATQSGTHSATFSRLKAGKLPGDDTMQRLLDWAGIEDPFEVVPVDDVPEDAVCAYPDCEEVPTHAVEVPSEEDPETMVSTLYCEEHAMAVQAEIDAAASEDPEKSDKGEELSEGGDCGCEHSTLEAAEAAVAESNTKVAAILGEGRLSDSEDPETQALVNRARELMIEGAAGVSIKHDLDPDDMPDPAVLDKLMEEGNRDEIDRLLAEVHARPRHVALVDTAAFSDARLTYDEETGAVTGPVAYEGHWTGDVRRLPYGVLTWDEDLLPIPITMGHEGPGGTQPPIIGYIDKLERQDGVTSSMRPVLGLEAVTAAAGPKALPATYFKKFKVDKRMPMKIDAPDEFGRRRIWGIAAPKGVCHRSDMGACFQFPGDVDSEMRNFHTGFEITLDDGSTVRPGALTSGGLHLDTGLARRGVDAHEANRHREDSNKVLALVKAWDTPHGLAITGMVAADVSESQLLQAMAGGPSVELWPAGRGRTLVGIHVVPTQAWPVVASAGSAVEFLGSEQIEIEQPPQVEAVTAAIKNSDIDARLDRIEKGLALLVQEKIANGIPEVADAE